MPIFFLEIGVDLLRNNVFYDILVKNTNGNIPGKTIYAYKYIVSFKRLKLLLEKRSRTNIIAQSVIKIHKFLILKLEFLDI